MHRRWRVRHSYPRPVVDLVELLLCTASGATVGARARSADERDLSLACAEIRQSRVAQAGAPTIETVSNAARAVRAARLSLHRAAASRPQRPEWLSIQVARRGLDDDVSSIATPLSLRTEDAGMPPRRPHTRAAVEETHRIAVARARTRPCRGAYAKDITRRDAQVGSGTPAHRRRILFGYRQQAACRRGADVAPSLHPHVQWCIWNIAASISDDARVSAPPSACCLLRANRSRSSRPVSDFAQAPV